VSDVEDGDGEAAEVDWLVADVVATGRLRPRVAQAGLTPLDVASDMSDWKIDTTGDDVVDKFGDKYDSILSYAPGTALPTLILPPGTGSVPVSVPPVAARMADASSIGGLSAPQGWTVAAPEIRLASLAMPATNLSAVPESPRPAALAPSSAR
jgi:hypothetical protein